MEPDLEPRLRELLALAGAEENLDQLYEILLSAVRLAGDGTERLNLKITNAALKEMREAFRVFGPYRDVPKVTVFGSARARPADPLYRLSCDVAAALADEGWMVVTGAGPGIMAAATEGAGPERSLGVNIRLPFEETTPFLAADPKLVIMKYFFTRKLMLMKESAGFVVLPGGFGTLDETFELLTLLQTGKAAPAPLVLLDTPGGSYWRAWDCFVRDELVDPGRAGPDDLSLYRVTDDVETAAAEILGFYRNYHSIRYVGRRLVVRLRSRPDADEMTRLNRSFSDLCRKGTIELTAPLAREVADADHLQLPRIALDVDRTRQGRIRDLIDALNNLSSAPALSAPSPDSAAAAGVPPEETGQLDDT